MTSLSSVSSFSESTLAALLRAVTKNLQDLRRVEEDVEYIQDRISEASTLLAELKEALEGAEQCKREAVGALHKTLQEAQAQGADEDDIYEANRRSYDPCLP